MTLIEASNLSAGYNKQPVIRNLDLSVDTGEIVALLGPNGAGKTTTLRALSGSLTLLGGIVSWKGANPKPALYQRCKNGLSYVTEERCIFFGLTVRQNLRVGNVSPATACELFPELASRMDVKAGNISGGEQQMLALARALGRRPQLLLADELSIGLSPAVVQRLLGAVRSAADSGVGVLIVEQFVAGALSIADRVYVLRNGVVELSCTADELRSDPAKLQASYLPTARNHEDS